MWTIGTNPFFILLLTKDELFKGITPRDKKKRKKEKNWNFKLTAHFFCYGNTTRNKTYKSYGQLLGCGNLCPACRCCSIFELSIAWYGALARVTISHKTTPNDHCEGINATYESFIQQWRISINRLIPRPQPVKSVAVVQSQCHCDNNCTIYIQYSSIPDSFPWSTSKFSLLMVIYSSISHS